MDRVTYEEATSQRTNAI